MPKGEATRSMGRRRSAIDPDGVNFLHISRKLGLAWLLSRGVTALVFLIISLVPLAIKQFLDVDGMPTWLVWGPPVLVLVIAAWVLLLIPRQVNAIGYAERNEDLLIRRGILFHRVMVVPYGRMQYVDVTMGPVERILGISTIHLHTASPGTNALIPGIAAAEADRLREQLSARGEAKLAGL